MVTGSRQQPNYDTKLAIEGWTFDRVQFEYLGSNVNIGIKMTEEIGRRMCFALVKVFSFSAIHSFSRGHS